MEQFLGVSNLFLCRSIVRCEMGTFEKLLHVYTCNLFCLAFWQWDIAMYCGLIGSAVENTKSH